MVERLAVKVLQLSTERLIEKSWDNGETRFGQHRGNCDSKSQSAVETRYRSSAFIHQHDEYSVGGDIVHTLGNHGICEIKRVLPFAGASPAAPTL